MKIIIMRHGKPRLSDWPKIGARELSGWIDAYTHSDVEGSVPNQEAVRAARECAVIVTSDLARSRGSALALASDTPRMISARLFREAEWPLAPVPLVRMRPSSWAALFRVLWFVGYRKNCGEPVGSLKRRAGLAADRLIALATVHGCVLFVGHGILNTFIVRALRRRGWKGPELPRYGFWAVSEYRKE